MTKTEENLLTDLVHNLGEFHPATLAMRGAIAGGGGYSNFHDVGAFHAKFNLHNVEPRSFDGAGPQEVTDDLLRFRYKFLHEELAEFKEAAQTGDHAKMFDALIDLVYVALGTAHLLGYPWQIGWNEVQFANMAKQRAAKDGSDSVRGSSFDVVKPEGWTPPDIERVLQLFGFDTDERDPYNLEGSNCPVCHDDFTPDGCQPGVCKGTR